MIQLSGVEQRFGKYIERVVVSRSLRWRVVLGVLAFSLFSYLLVPLGFVENVFFPTSDTKTFYVGITLPAGATVGRTEAITLQVLDKISTLEELELAVAEVGAAPLTGFGNGLAADSTANITVRLVDSSKRARTSSEIGDLLRDSLTREGIAGEVSVFVPSGGPPVGSDVVLKIVGDELPELQRIATEVEAYLAEQEGVINVRRSVTPGQSQLVFEPDQAALSDAGLTSLDVGFWMRTNLSGFTLAEVVLTDSTERDRVQLYFADRLFTPEELELIAVPTPQQLYPLSSVGRLHLAPSPSQITRENGERTLTVSAGVQEEVSAAAVNAALLEHVEKLEVPSGYRFDTGGANEENERSVRSILLAMILSFILILVTMVLQLGSFRLAALVMLVIPLAVSGVFVLFALTGTPLSFPALIGVLALFGIVVNNSIILVDKINQNIQVGLPFVAAISDGAASRLQPILFSSLTTIIGLIPITLSDPLWQGLGGAIIAGLTVSGLIMLLFIPVMYWWLFHKQHSKVAVSK